MQGRITDESLKKRVRNYLLVMLSRKGIDFAELCRVHNEDYNNLYSRAMNQSGIDLEHINNVLKLANYTHRVDFINGDFCEVYKSKL
jgi:site-specific DNA-adenine methylase